VSERTELDLHQCNNVINGLRELLGEAAKLIQAAYRGGRADLVRQRLEERVAMVTEYLRRIGG
jgi:chromosome condensin MukBEF MukE localization factor